MGVDKERSPLELSGNNGILSENQSTEILDRSLTSIGDDNQGYLDARDKNKEYQKIILPKNWYDKLNKSTNKKENIEITFNLLIDNIKYRFDYILNLISCESQLTKELNKNKYLYSIEKYNKNVNNIIKNNLIATEINEKLKLKKCNLKIEVKTLSDISEEEARGIMQDIMSLHKNKYDIKRYDKFLKEREKEIRENIDNELTTFIIYDKDGPVISLYTYKKNKNNIYIGGLYSNRRLRKKINGLVFFNTIEKILMNLNNEIEIHINYSACGIKNKNYRSSHNYLTFEGYKPTKREIRDDCEVTIMKKNTIN